MTESFRSSALDLRLPSGKPSAFVFACPHSGRSYPAEFVKSSRLSLDQLRQSEDSFVEELFASAPEAGAPLLAALFPRAYVDVNRDAREIDATMFSGPLGLPLLPASPRVAQGLGVIPAIVAPGQSIYAARLPAKEAAKRLEDCYAPWHKTLDALLEQAKEIHGWSALIDCHSMPRLSAEADIVLGDLHGRSCAKSLIDCAEATLRDMGYRVVRNAPYAGGYDTKTHGRPEQNRHALQIEISRPLYMDERMREKSAGFERVRQDIGALVQTLISFSDEGLRQ